MEDSKVLDSSRSNKIVIEGARMKSSKRDRDGAADLSTEGKTPKKKKKKKKTRVSFHHSLSKAFATYTKDNATT